MRVDILTIFPGMFQGPLTESLINKAREKKLLDIRITDIRSFSKDKHRSVDDRPFGGGPGMLMKPDTVFDALSSAAGKLKKNPPRWPSVKKPLVIFMSPQGSVLDHALVEKLSEYRHLVLLCGHYEGVDERALKYVNQEISIGDYVLTGGELPAMVLIDAGSRFVPGVVKDPASVRGDSFFNGLLDYPHYTRPAKFKSMSVPSELLSGDHKLVERWRRDQSINNTKAKRPDLFKKYIKKHKNKGV